jgi:hypothetical protein
MQPQIFSGRSITSAARALQLTGLAACSDSNACCNPSLRSFVMALHSRKTSEGSVDIFKDKVKSRKKTLIKNYQSFLLFRPLIFFGNRDGAESQQQGRIFQALLQSFPLQLHHGSPFPKKPLKALSISSRIK